MKFLLFWWPAGYLSPTAHVALVPPKQADFVDEATLRRAFHSAAELLSLHDASLEVRLQIGAGLRNSLAYLRQGEWYAALWEAKRARRLAQRLDLIALQPQRDRS